MKSDYSIRLAAVTLFTMLAPSVIAAQDGHARHHHYQLIDMSALGGSAGCINEPTNSVPALNAHGSTVGTSATALQTSASNPTAINCSRTSHAFEWHNGTLTDLATLAGQDFNSDADSINDNGVVEDISENGLLDPALGFNQVRATTTSLGVNSSTISPQSLPISANGLARWRARLAQPYHIPGLLTPKD